MHFYECKVCYFDQISLKLDPKGPIDNKSALVQIMAWHQPGDKPLSEPMMVSLCLVYASFNSIALGRWGDNFKSITFKLVIQKSSMVICCDIVLRWMQQNLTNEKSTLIQVMPWWCHQATSHYIWTNADQVVWCHMAPLSHNELTTEAKTKWPPHCRLHFDKHFLEWKIIIVWFDFH